MADSTNFITLIDSADSAGRISILAYKDVLPIKNLSDVRQYLDITFLELRLLNLRLDLVKKAIQEIDLSWRACDKGAIIELNLAKLMLLPAEAPAAELAEFREMLVEMRAFFESNYGKRCDIQLCNERDHHRRIYGSAAFRVVDDPKTCRARRDEEATRVLNERIERSPALSSWLRQVALNLQKIGPYSWSTITEGQVFGDLDGPYSRYIRSRPTEQTSEPVTQVLYKLEV